MLERDKRELIEAINRGAILLDVIAPDWHRRVNPYRLDMWSDARDILSQVFGSYDKGIEALAGRDSLFKMKPDDAAYANGYNVRAGRSEPHWGWADQLWAGHVERRLAAEAAESAARASPAP